MKIAKVIMLIGSALFAAVALAGCNSTDVVAKVANTSFAAVIAASDQRVAWSEEDYAWSLASPNGDQVLFSSDFSRNNASGADLDKPDAEFVFDAAPFIAAGLDIAKLPAVDGIKYEIEDGEFMIHFELGSDKAAPDAKKSLGATFAEIVKFQRTRVGYHEKLDHYGVKLGNGNMFEWAKDLSTNDKDIVFVLNPEPFIAAGLDPSKIEGWVFAKVETKDDAGKTIQVDKLLKPFNLK
ncbi:hypothetical protein K7J14_10795 [Treponema zuelzerae]|uniref:Lipoprotein n=1 Tax=Teretinema zuelzerae TaxID=156 RepID=A0AAE3EIR1_9SPIR|nr:hypothetical protein [Teretinema zuelzerae]MCD1655186.1 hypothetical protein [Teretinema zuelzerae]